MPPPNLHPYQEYAAQFIASRWSSGLFLDMGLGKTLITLTALSRIRPTGHILVIAPLAIARSTWLDEIEKWGFDISVVSLVVNERGRRLTRAERHKLYAQIPEQPASLYIINKELLPDLVNALPTIQGPTLDRRGKLTYKRVPVWPFKTVVIDESQRFKNPHSVGFKTLLRIRPQIIRLIALSGTPAPQNLLDIWSQIYLLDQGNTLGAKFNEFRANYFQAGKTINGQVVNYHILDGAEDIIHEKIKPLVISMKNTYLKLPPLTFNQIKIRLSDEEMARYKTFARDALIEIANNEILKINEENEKLNNETEELQLLDAKNDDDIESATSYIIMDNAAILANKLNQFSSGALYTGEKDEYVVVHEHKLDILESIVETTSSPVLVAYGFKFDKIEIMKRLKASNINVVAFDGSSDMMNAWNAGEYEVMLIHPASAGHGINIQEGGHTLVWYTLPLSSEQYQQTNARLYRQGQTQPVMIHELITTGTYGARVPGILAGKISGEAALFEATKAVLD